MPDKCSFRMANPNWIHVLTDISDGKELNEISVVIDDDVIEFKYDELVKDRIRDRTREEKVDAIFEADPTIKTSIEVAYIKCTNPVAWTRGRIA